MGGGGRKEERGELNERETKVKEGDARTCRVAKEFETTAGWKEGETESL